MRAVIQRVSQAQVTVNGTVSGAIGQGLLVLLGVHAADSAKDIQWLAEKIVHLRIFDDEKGVMNHSLHTVGGQLLVVSQFTLYGDCRKGRRPSWSGAAPPHQAERLYDQFIEECTRIGFPPQTGTFQAEMEVRLTNNGPVTLLLDSHKTF